MKRDYRDYLHDILTSIDEAGEFTADMTMDSFLADRKTAKAVIRSLEVLGEAAKQIPKQVQARAPGVPWKRMAGMRDKLAHEYFGVDLTIVWAVVKEEIPPLRPQVERLLDELNRSGI